LGDTESKERASLRGRESAVEAAMWAIRGAGGGKENAVTE
jgi:hypothetical protein